MQEPKSPSMEKLCAPAAAAPTIEITCHDEVQDIGRISPPKYVPLPRRLSKLFSPMNKEEEEFLKSKNEEALSLLSGSSRDVRQTLQPPQLGGHLQRRKSEDFLLSLKASASFDCSGGPGGRRSSLLSVRSNIEEEDTREENEPSESSSDSSSSHGGDEDDEDDDNKGYTSWDDTICSNRSSYFKLYYQRNLAALSKEENRSRAPTRNSSYTSLASLIHEKDKMTTTDKEEKKVYSEKIGLGVLVGILFIVLVVGISLIYHFYHLHLEELSLFKRLKFNEEERLLELFSDSQGKLVVLSNLGLTLPRYSKAEDCTEYLKCLQLKEEQKKVEYDMELDSNISLSLSESINEFEFDNETVCLDWAYQARVQIHKAPTRDGVNCYNVYWLAHHQGSLKDCVIISDDVGVWWGIGELSGGGFPLKISNINPSLYETHQLGEGSWGQIIRRSFISSLGGIVTLPNHLPAVVSIEDNERLCISVNTSAEYSPKLYSTLNYTICSSPNMSAALDYLHHLAAGGIYNPLTKEKIELPPLPHDYDRKERILRRIEKPVFVPYMEPNNPELTQEAVMKYVEKVIEGNSNRTGDILLPISWQSKLGDFTFDPERFPDPKKMIKALKEKGMPLALTISPVISTETEAFYNGTRDGLWVQQKHSSLPILISYQGTVACALVDFTNPKASDWFVSKVHFLKEEFELEDFHLILPDSGSIPKYHEFHNGIPNPDLAIHSYVKSVYEITPPMSTEAAITPPAPPTFVTVGSEESGWESLSSLIPRILTLSLLGYPLIDAGIIGGKPSRPGNIPDEELFIRWVEAVAFLPAFQAQVLPESISPQTKSIVETFVKMRDELALPRFRKGIENIFVNSTPLISPLGLLFPEDLTAGSVGDEWIVGHDLLVAPILHKGKTSRNVYIPAGIWESQADRSLKQGPGWIYDYKVPLTEVAYFMKRKIIS